MLLQIALAVAVVLVALAYFLHCQRRLSKDIQELQAAAETYVTLDDFDSSIQPRIDALEKSQGASQRHVSMLASSVRALERQSLRPAEGGTTDIEDAAAQEMSGGEEDDEESMLLDEVAQGAAHTEDQLQAVLSSMANIFGMSGGGHGGREAAIPMAVFSSPLSAFAPTSRVVLSESHPIIEEEMDNEAEEKDEEEGEENDEKMS